MKIIIKFFLIVCSFCLYISGNAYFEIVEVMPNTTDDKNLEYITIKNTSSEPQTLSGYTLADKKKQYIFPGGVLLDGGARRDFFRPDTKLVLNNSDEEIYLYNPQGEKIDEISYEDSIKGEFLTFQDISGNDGGYGEIISQEFYISGEIFSLQGNPVRRKV